MTSARRLGRPPLDENDETVPVHLSLPARDYDEAFKRAQAAGVSVPEILRRDLREATTKKT